MKNDEFIKHFGLYGIYYLSNLFQTAKDFSDYVMDNDSKTIKNLLLLKTKWR